MAKARSEKKREKNDGAQPSLPGTREPPPPSATRVLPMQLQIGDRLSDETGEWEVLSRPHTTAGGKVAHPTPPSGPPTTACAPTVPVALVGVTT